MLFFFFQAEDGIRDIGVTGVQTCALPILLLSSDSAEELVSQMGTLEAIAGHNSAAVTEVAEASDRAEDSREEARSAREKAERSVADIQGQQKALEAKIADYQRQYAALDAAQRALVERAQGDSQPVRASRGTERTAPRDRKSGV